MRQFIFLLAGMVANVNFATAKDFLFISQDFPPFSWQEGPDVKGGMTDVVREVCKELKFTCRFEIEPLARALKMIQVGNAAGVMNLTSDPDRLLYSVFSTPIMKTGMAYLGRKDAKLPVLKSTAEFDSWTVAGVRGSNSLKKAQKQLAQNHKVTFSEEVDNAALIQRLKKNTRGNKVLIIGSLDVLQYLAKKDNLEIEPIYNVEQQELIIAFSKKNISSDEITSFNKTIVALKKNGSLGKILTNYNLKEQ